MRLLEKHRKEINLEQEELQYINTYRNIYRNVTKEAKTKDNDNYLTNTKNKTKASWQIINNEMGRSSSRHENIELMWNSYLSKAYDVINHKILLTKLEDYGFTGVVNKGLVSYLTGHNQCVEVKYKGNKDIILDNVKSDLKEIHSGVPQQSILGPVLFLLFINDLTRHILDAEVVLFADDTNILIQAEDKNVIQLKVNRTMNTLYNWFYTNRLVINTEKSAAVSFHSWQNKNPIKPQIRFNNLDITYTSETKFLGIHLMESLKWEAHIKAMCSKLNEGV
ncbi:hypothetical protein Cfor_09086 [Coptotermes formosanus]|uniref:Reverse transcriptase domain-containing protein n=1 Tax=Coptotermes formosanus TaxID=36987 RepID=A0A6L2P7Y6_COPFO|nr:hypothetical protein Cfor_09086 [Coptotermes formosanus]